MKLGRATVLSIITIATMFVGTAFAQTPAAPDQGKQGPGGSIAAAVNTPPAPTPTATAAPSPADTKIADLEKKLKEADEAKIAEAKEYAAKDTYIFCLENYPNDAARTSCYYDLMIKHQGTRMVMEKVQLKLRLAIDTLRPAAPVEPVANAPAPTVSAAPAITAPAAVQQPVANGLAVTCEPPVASTALPPTALRPVKPVQRIARPAPSAKPADLGLFDSCKKKG